MCLSSVSSHYKHVVILFHTTVSSPHIDDIATMIDIAKKTAQAANATAGATMDKLKDINKELDALKARNITGSPDQGNIDRMLEDVDMAGGWKCCFNG